MPVWALSHWAAVQVKIGPEMGRVGETVVDRVTDAVDIAEAGTKGELCNPDRDHSLFEDVGGGGGVRHGHDLGVAMIRELDDQGDALGATLG